MSNAPHIINPWSTGLQWLCGVLSHVDRNYADEDQHYSYCLRCGKLFGHPWGSDKVNKRAFEAPINIVRGQRDLAEKRCVEFAAMLNGTPDASLH